MVASSNLPASQVIEFKKSEEKVLTGKSSKQKTGEKDETPIIKAEDCLDTFGVVSKWYQNGCYTDGGYNCNDWKTEKGDLAGIKAYLLNPPTGKPKNFLGSQHCIAFKIPDKDNYKIYKFESGSLALAAELNSQAVKPGEFNIIPTIEISTLGNPTIFLAEKANKRISPHTILKEGVEGSMIYQDKNLKIEQVRFGIPEDPYTPEDFNHGPAAHENCYGPKRNFFRVELSDKEAIVWGNPTNENIYLTHFNRTTFETKSVKLESKVGWILAAATGDNDFLYYIIAEAGEGKGKKDIRGMQVIKADIKTGKTTKQEKLPTDKDNLNVFCFDTCNMAISGKFLGVMLSRRMTQSSDGLNHQGGYACVVNCDSLATTKHFGQTSGHSFSNSLTVRSDGKFCGMDLGDNYPRGVNQWNFTPDKLESRVVYTFKTLHGTESKSPAGASYPAYNEISTGTKKFYKWSNDNKTYTELGAPGIAEISNGTFVFFAGENTPNPLDNSKTGDYCNCSRNVGYVKVSKTLTSDPSTILSDGPVQDGGFYSFGGSFDKQQNRGIKWLTKFDGENNVSRLKTSLFGDKILVLFELWSKTSYISTHYLLMKLDGTASEPTKLPFKLRLHRSDDIFASRTAGSVVFYAGEKGKTLNRYEIKAP